MIFIGYKTSCSPLDLFYFFLLIYIVGISNCTDIFQKGSNKRFLCCTLTFWFLIFWLRRRNPKVWLLLAHTLSTWVDQERSEEKVTPKYLVLSTDVSVCQFNYLLFLTSIFLVIGKTVLLAGWNPIAQVASHCSTLSRSSWHIVLSVFETESLYNAASSVKIRVNGLSGISWINSRKRACPMTEPWVGPERTSTH